MRILYKELPPRYKSEDISISAGWIVNSTLAYYWHRTKFFLVGGIKAGRSIELYFGFWYINIFY